MHPNEITNILQDFVRGVFWYVQYDALDEESEPVLCLEIAMQCAYGSMDGTVISRFKYPLYVHHNKRGFSCSPRIH